MTHVNRRTLVLQALAAGAAAIAAPAAHAQLRLFQQPYDDPYWDQQPDAPTWNDPGLDLDVPHRRPPPGSADPRVLYGPVPDEPFPVPAVKASIIRPEFVRRQVTYDGPEDAGSLVIDPRRHHLYFVQGDGTAIRYGVGVGRSGFGWSGEAYIHDKQRWPDWYPPKEMLDRQPELRAKMQELQSGLGMPGGPGNPLGARAMYLWQGNKDTLYRVHGTVEPWTIGHNVSSGCIRMINQDAIDLHDRVAVGARVLVLGAATAGRGSASG